MTSLQVINQAAKLQRVGSVLWKYTMVGRGFAKNSMVHHSILNKHAGLNICISIHTDGVICSRYFCHQSTRCYSADGFDRLRKDVEGSFSVNDDDDGIVHGVAVSKSGKTLTFPFLNPDKETKKDSGDDNTREQKLPSTTEKAEGTKTKPPSVTRILDQTKPWQQRLMLLKWEKKMISQVGKEGFALFRKEMFSEGKSHHQNIEAMLHGIPEEELTMTPGIAGYWKSVRPVLDDMDHVECMERRILHPALDYGGIVDCVGQYKGELYAIEWKTSKKPKRNLKQCYEHPLQVVAYAGALNYDPTFNHQIKQALLVIAYQDGKPADVHKMSTNDCEHYWTLWLERVLQYRERMETENAKAHAKSK